MKFKAEHLKEILCESSVDEAGLTFVEATEWEQDYKYQNRLVVFKHEDKFYGIWESRSGSPFTEWHYDNEDWLDDEMIDVDEVEKVEIVTYEWR